MSSNLDHTHTGCLPILLCERATVQAVQPGPSENGREEIENCTGVSISSEKRVFDW